MRNGRFDKIIYVGPLDIDGRIDYFKTWYYKKLELKNQLQSSTISVMNQFYEDLNVKDSNIDDEYNTNYEETVNIIGRMTENFTGADCSLLVKKACLECYRETKFQLIGHKGSDDTNDIILPDIKHFSLAYNQIQPSCSLNDIIEYTNWRKHLKY
jgi:SpoVK/Ycf46/Vps4 family AAA+-type ATPase